MTTLGTIPDLERVLGDLLRDDPNIVAFDARVAGELPRSFTRPWIKITQLDATDATPSANATIEHLISYLVQLDCFAGSEAAHAQAEASDLAKTVRAVLIAVQGQQVDGVTITAVAVRSHARIPDLAFEPPRERYALTVEVHAHA